MRWGPAYFGDNNSNGPQTFEDTDGYAVNLTFSDANADGLNLSNWHTQNGPTSRSAGSWNMENTLNWQKGRHSVNLGAAVYAGSVWADGQQMVPGINRS